MGVESDQGVRLRKERIKDSGVSRNNSPPACCSLLCCRVCAREVAPSLQRRARLVRIPRARIETFANKRLLCFAGRHARSYL